MGSNHVFAQAAVLSCAHHPCGIGTTTHTSYPSPHQQVHTTTIPYTGSRLTHVPTFATRQACSGWAHLAKHNSKQLLHKCSKQAYLTCFLRVKHVDHVDAEVALQPAHVVAAAVDNLVRQRLVRNLSMGASGLRITSMRGIQ